MPTRLILCLASLLGCMLYSGKSLAQQLFPIQQGFHCQVNGAVQQNDSVLVLYGYFENVPTDSGYQEFNICFVNQKTGVKRFAKLTKRKKAEIRKLYRSPKNQKWHALLYYETCNEGAKGNALTLVDNAWQQADSLFFVEYNFIRVKEPVGDWLELKRGHYVSTFGNNVVYLDRSGRTLNLFEALEDVEQIVLTQAGNLLLRNASTTASIDSTGVLNSNLDYGDELVDLVALNDGSGLLALAGKKSLRFINADGEVRGLFDFASLGMERILAVSYENNLLYVYGVKKGKIEVRGINSLDQIVFGKSVGSMEPQDALSGVIWTSQQQWLVIERRQQDQRFDFLLKIDDGQNQQDLEMQDVSLEQIIVDSVVFQAPTKWHNASVIPVLYCRVRLLNRGDDTLENVLLHHKGLYSANCDFNTTTQFYRQNVPPGQNSIMALVLRDSFPDWQDEYELCLGLSRPNGLIDSVLQNNVRCRLQKLINVQQPSQFRVNTIYPNPVNAGGIITLPGERVWQEVLLFGPATKQYKFDETPNGHVQVPHDIKKGLYMLKAFDIDGNVFIAKLMVL